MDESLKKHLLAGAGMAQNYDFCSGYGLHSVSGGKRYGKRTGSSMEFMEHRDYQAGDDLRTLDWSVYARTDKLVVKMFQEEIAPRLDLIVDGSRSMHIDGLYKAEAAMRLAGLFAQAALNCGFVVNSYVSRNSFRSIVNGHMSPEKWLDIDFTGDINPYEAMQSRSSSFQNNSLRVFISDLLWEEHPLKLLAMLNENARGVFVVQLLGKNELNPVLDGNSKLLDVESGVEDDLFIDSTALRNYAEALKNHISFWQRSCREINGFLTTLEADSVCSEWKIDKLIEVGLITRSS